MNLSSAGLRFQQENSTFIGEEIRNFLVILNASKIEDKIDYLYYMQFIVKLTNKTIIVANKCISSIDYQLIN